jgi:5-oxopent-3-ene-1,2,5-tricarboxylate decarboxylase / 2-hydroxyhepta-2,4-diene-1,7-dioate isomerase
MAHNFGMDKITKSSTETPPWLPQGTVYGTLMNFKNEHAALAAQMDAPPYKTAPQAPVLYIKPANTFSAHGSAIALPARVPAVQVRACVGIIFQSNKAAAQLNIAGAAHKNIASAVLFNDLTIPHESFYRPPVKFKCLDGFLCAGQIPHALPDVAALDALTVTVRINGAAVQTFSTADMVRSAAQLVADVAEFIDVQSGDVLLLGSPFDAPLARVGDVVEISAPGFAPLRHTLVAQTGERV